MPALAKHHRGSHDHARALRLHREAGRASRVEGIASDTPEWNLQIGELPTTPNFVDSVATTTWQLT